MNLVIWLLLLLTVVSSGTVVVFFLWAFSGCPRPNNQLLLARDNPPLFSNNALPLNQSALERANNKMNDEKSRPTRQEVFDAMKKPREDILNGFICPISLEIFKEPVVAEDGHTYERNEISAWLNINQTSPVTRKSMGTRLVPNQNIIRAIDDWLERLSNSTPNTLSPTPNFGSILQNNSVFYKTHIVARPELASNQSLPTLS